MEQSRECRSSSVCRGGGTSNRPLRKGDQLNGEKPGESRFWKLGGGSDQLDKILLMG